MRFAAFSTVTLAFALLGACSSSSSSAPAKSVDDECTTYASGLCNTMNGCAAIYLQIGFGDVATCTSRLKDACKAGATAPNTGITLDVLDKCANSAASTSCTDLLSGVRSSACNPPPGTLEDGKPCADDAQCKSTFCGVDESKSLCGTCAPKPAEGAACFANDCTDGLKCINLKCVKLVAEGGTCDPDHPCGAFLNCVAGKCGQQAQADGAACDKSAGIECDARKGLFCLDKRCVKVVLVGEGKECGLHTSGVTIKDFTLCEKSGFCDGLEPKAVPPKFLGVCKPAAKDNEACAVGDDPTKPHCLPPAECIGGFCKLRDPASCK